MTIWTQEKLEEGINGADTIAKLRFRVEELEARLDTKLRSGERWKELYEQERLARTHAEIDRQAAIDARDAYVAATTEDRRAHAQLVEERDAANEREKKTNETNWNLIAHVGTLQRALDTIANPPDPSTNSDLTLVAIRALDAVAENA